MLPARFGLGSYNPESSGYRSRRQLGESSQPTGTFQSPPASPSSQQTPERTSEAASSQAIMAFGGESLKRPTDTWVTLEDAPKNKRARSGLAPIDAGYRRRGQPNFRFTSEQRQEILRIFTNDPNRNNADIARQFGIGNTALGNLRKRFHATGNIDSRDKTKRLTSEQRQEIWRIFTNESK